MRHALVAVTLVAAFLTVPASGALTPTLPAEAPIASRALPPLLAEALAQGDAWDPSNAELVRALALVVGHDVRAPTLRVPADATLEQMLLHIGQRGGTPLAPEDVEPFLALDTRVQTPVLMMLLAIDQAWTLRDHAFRDIDANEMRELAQLTLAGEYTTPRYVELHAQVDPLPLFEAAILLMDTLDDIVIPAVREAHALGVWPPIAVADPVGIVRLGSGGDDVETLDRILQIDPDGNDAYYNNAGGTTLLSDLNFLSSRDWPVALHIDLAGDDVYESASTNSQGSGFVGIGIMLDFQGRDHYKGHRLTQGAGDLGVGYHRDYEGDDDRWIGGNGGGGTGTTMGILRDDAGDDELVAYSSGSGYAIHEGAVGLLWDRDGQDHYEPYSSWSLGWGDDGGRGWLVDDGVESDYYRLEFISSEFAHGCNDCSWIAGRAGDLVVTIHGRGNDNDGGLPKLIADDYASTT